MFGVMFLISGATPSSDPERPSALDWILSAAGLGCGVFLAVNAEELLTRIPQLDELSGWAMGVGTVIVLLTLEATRRATGLGLLIVVLLFMAYNLLGHRLDGVIGHGYISVADFVEITVFTTNGVFGVPVRVAASYAFLFVLFGTLLSRTGGGEFFFNFAAALNGRRVGGPAKIAVISSGFYGMLSGSSVSDVVTTGSITIPMMRRMGYSSVFAAATEVSASTGGSLMPPVMGAAAFVMVEYTGIDYSRIALAALIPALLYYLAVYAQVHLRALRYGLGGMPADQIPTFRKTMADGWVFVIPLGVLVAALVAEYTPTYVALFGSAAVLVVSALRYRKSGLTLGLIYDVLAETTWRVIAVAGACAAAGMVIGGLTLTGLAQKFAHLIYGLTDSSLLPTLLIAAGLTLVLGLGMPTVSAYILAAVLVGPVLNELGVNILAAHMFILYFAVLSAITPPVAVAAYAAAAIADDNPLAISVAAVRLAIVAFVIPFAFVYGPELLLVGTALEIVFATATAVAGIVLLAIAVEGFLKRPLGVPSRLLFAAGGACFIFPSWHSALAGIAILLLIGVYTLARPKKRDAA